MALLLGKQGILVDVLEKSTTIDTQPRATHFSTPATYELDRAGVLDEMYSGGFVPSEVCWRSLEGTKLGGLKINDAFPKGYPHKLVCYPLDRLGPLLNKHVMNVSNVRVQWACNVVKVEQNASSAWVEAETPEGIQKFEADYVVGCDGARSIIRRQLFGDEFLGFTWFEQIVATNVSVLPAPPSLCSSPETLMDECRRTTTLTNSAGMTATSSLTRSTTSWQPVSVLTVARRPYGASPTGNCRG